MPVILASKKIRQKGHGFEATLGYTLVSKKTHVNYKTPPRIH